MNLNPNGIASSSPGLWRAAGHYPGNTSPAVQAPLSHPMGEGTGVRVRPSNLHSCHSRQFVSAKLLAPITCICFVESMRIGNLTAASPPSPPTCARPLPVASARPLRLQLARSSHSSAPETPARKRRPKQQNLQILFSVMIFDRNSQVRFHKPMKLEPLAKINRARARARSQS